MQLINDNSERRLLAGPIALLVALLAGCGGGGGGGGGGSGLGPSTPMGFNYPTLATASNSDMGGFSSAYTQTGNVITSTQAATGGTVSASRNGAEFTFIVTGIPIGGATEPQFQFTVNLATPGVGFSAPSTLAGAGCGNCFRTGTVGTAAGTVDFTYLDLSSSGMVYSTLGVWSKPSTVPGGGGTNVGGAFAFGVLTRGVDLPTTSTATYTGPFVGRYADGTTVYTVGAAATAVADFGARSVAFSTLNSQRTAGAVVTGDNGLNLTGTLTYAPGVNSLTGTVATSAGNNMSGVAKGAFFGPPGATAPFAPPEFGGVVAVTNGNTQSMVGSFALKR